MAATKKLRNTHKKNHHEVEILKFSSSIAKFDKFYKVEDFRWKIVIILLMGMVIGTVSLFFIKNSGLYSLGVAAISQGLSRIITTSIDVKANLGESNVHLISTLTFWFLLVLLNVPLMFFSWKKVGKKFTLLTIIYLISMSAFGFALDQIPNVKDVFILGNVETILKPIKAPVVDGVQQLTVPVTFLTWTDGDVEKVISLVFYSIVAPVLTTGCYAVIYIIGGSTGGSDVISIYYFKKTLKSLGKIFLIFNVTFLFIGYFMGSYLTIGIAYGKWDPELALIGPNFVCSLIIILLFSFLLELLYPRYKMCSVKCFGANVKKINDKLNEVEYIHNRTLYEGIGSYSKKKVDSMEIYCFYIELGDLVRFIRELDKDMMIVINKGVEVNGNFKMHKFIE